MKNISSQWHGQRRWLVISTPEYWQQRILELYLTFSDRYRQTFPLAAMKGFGIATSFLTDAPAKSGLSAAHSLLSLLRLLPLGANS
jgi:hypothetical protein